MNKKKNIITFAAFLILMVGLGANDAMRGIFSTIFSAHFQLSTAQLSQIVTVSYIGNLVFLAVGGFGVDILGRRWHGIWVIPLPMRFSRWLPLSL